MKTVCNAIRNVLAFATAMAVPAVLVIKTVVLADKANPVLDIKY